ncbi:hydrogenase expression/formation protein HypE, partial [Litorivivens sp.]|uniref:hydrogenase expression/formation protein HypE n=1 Tax=Litorivivens sp. TaxID=2020868 RepID=UPI00356297BE
LEELRYLLETMRYAAHRTGVSIVTGDTKVVPRGAVDGMYINTAGIGCADSELDLTGGNFQISDKIIVSGPIGNHGLAILCARGELKLNCDITSDCQPIHAHVAALLSAAPNTRILRDATRGGVATVVNEITENSNLGAYLTESTLPVRQEVRSACELLGFDPLWLANEGTFVAVVPDAQCDAALTALRQYPECREATVIGGFSGNYHGTVALRTPFGGERSLDVPSGELLPRIC